MSRRQRLVPASFADFRTRRVRQLTDAELLATGAYGCRGCGEHAAFGYLIASGELLCEGCLRYVLAYEQSTEESVRLIIGSAVAAALAAGATEALVHLAVEDAFVAAVRVETDLDE